MRKLNQFVQHVTVSSLLVAATLASSAWAVPPVSDLFESCREEVQLSYGDGGEAVRVRLDDMRRSGRELQLSVVSPDGERFRAVCEVDRKSGLVISLDPRNLPEQQDRLAVAGAE